MLWKEIQRSRTEGQLDCIWAEIERLNRKSSKSAHDQNQLADLKNLAAELQSDSRLERFDRYERLAFVGGFGSF